MSSGFHLKLLLSMLALTTVLMGASPTTVEARKMRMIIDADTANEIDDYYAIVRALLASELEIEGLTASSFRAQVPGQATVLQSHMANQEILALMNLTEKVPALCGAEGSMPDTATALDSPAVQHIIRRAHAGSAANPLWVVALGQCTNLASALVLDPGIITKVRFAFIDGDFKDGRWGPGIYNWKNDIAAVKIVFESAVDYHHMPARSVSGTLKMDKGAAIAHLRGRGGIHDYLLSRWELHPAAERTPWTMWDVALIEALLRPGLATKAVVGAPIIHNVKVVEQFPANPRRVTVWTDINVEGMLADFWEALDRYPGRRVDRPGDERR
jgi:inosine-uridine nucleoside N-ribohydrolase